MWAFLDFLLNYWAKITGGILGTVGLITLYVTQGGPYPVSQYHVDAKVAVAQNEIIRLRSPLRALQIGQIDGQISRLEGEQDTLLADKARMAIDFPKITDQVARGIIEKRLQEIDTRLKRVAKDIDQLEKSARELRSTTSNAPAQ